MRINLDTEKAARHESEQKLLNAEKEKSEMCVDLAQLRQQAATLKQDLHAETQKVWMQTDHSTYLFLYVLLNLIVLYFILFERLND